MPSSTRRARPRSDRLSRAGDNATPAQELLRGLAGVLLETAPSKSALIAQFAKACDEAERAGGEEQLAVRKYADRLTEITARWMSDADYLDELGHPLALPFRGPRASLSKLVRAVFSNADVGAVLRSLIKSRAIRRQGRRYVVVERYVSFAAETRLAQAHALDAAALLLQTAKHNMSVRTPEERLFERSASNDSIPVHALPAIRQRFKEDMGALVDRHDEFLRELSVPTGSEPTIGVVLGGYCAVRAGSGNPSKSKRSQSPRAPGVKR